MRKKIVGCVQMRSTGDLRQNMDTILRFIDDGDARGCTHIAYPENSLFLGTSEPSSKVAVSIRQCDQIKQIQQKLAQCKVTKSVSVGLLERPTEADLAAIRAAAVTHDGGGGDEQTKEAAEKAEDKCFNSLVYVSAEGVTSVYRKIHLFDYGRLHESRTTLAGNAAIVVDDPHMEGICIGLSICYDLRFPELYERLRARGAHAMLVPAAFTEATGRAHWHALLRARAIEQQSYVIAAAQWGRHNEDRASYGHSVIYDHWGTLVAQAPEFTDALITAELDVDALEGVRKRMPVKLHRKEFT